MNIQTVASFYQALNKGNLSQLGDIYHAEVEFRDPAHRIKGIEALTQYFEVLYQNVNECQFEILYCQQKEQKGFIRWVMFLSHPRLKQGEKIEVNGSSYLEFSEGKILQQHDYFDLGEMLYEHLPVIGLVVRAVKKQLGS